MSLIAIGDIHGCRRTLQALLEKLPLDSAEQIVFVGDYVDRGPDSKGVIDDLLELREKHSCIFLQGNHEAMMLNYLSGSGYNLWARNGGIETLESYESSNGRLDIPSEHAEFISSTPLYHETEDYFFVHAGLRPDLSIEENLERYGSDVFLWERSHLEASSCAWEKTVICGHTPVSEPISRDRLIVLDTGCVYHRHSGLGHLTAVTLPSLEFTSVPYQG